MASAGPVEGAACVWALAEPAAIEQNAAAIEKALREALGAKDPNRHRVTIAPGFIEHVDTIGMWHTNGAALPTLEEARTFAGAVVKRVVKEVSVANPALAALGAVELVPTRLRVSDILQVAATEGGGWDHWLVRSRPQLPLDPAGGVCADVFGAMVEVRIGPAGAVLGFFSRWRPVLDEHVEVALAPPPSSQGPASSSGGQQGEPVILYVLDGESTPQQYLAPFYPGEDEEDLTLASATHLSLVVNLAPYSAEDPRKYVAVVEGGSGEYSFDWATLPFSEFAENVMVELGGGEIVADRSTDPPSNLSVVELSPGSHLVLVNVVDLKTGAFTYHSEQVYVAEPEDTSPQVA
jgi:hypothetical protein